MAVAMRSREAIAVGVSRNWTGFFTSSCKIPCPLILLIPIVAIFRMYSILKEVDAKYKLKPMSTTKTNPLYARTCSYDSNSVSVFAKGLTNSFGEPYCVASALLPDEAEDYIRRWSNREDMAVCALPVSP